MFILVCGSTGTGSLFVCDAKCSLIETQTTVSDLVKIAPEDFQKPSIESIEDNINAKYANRVLFLRVCA